MYSEGLIRLRKTISVSVSPIYLKIGASILAIVLALIVIRLSLLLNRWWLPTLCIPILISGLYFRNQLWPIVRAAVCGLAAALILGYGFYSVDMMRSNVATPLEFDFQVFWLHGRVAAENLPFYSSDSYYQVAVGREYTDDYKREVFDSAFIYPLPSMFLFAPLGHFDIHTAFLGWYVVQSAVIILCAFFLWRSLVPDSGVLGILVVTALMLTLYGSLLTVLFGQSTFMTLLLLVLAYRDRDYPRMGLWLVLGIFVKPFVAIMLLLPVVRMQGRVLLTALIATAVLMLMSIAVFGWDNFQGFLGSNTASNVPDWLYTQINNQSLLATILRATGAEGGDSTLFNPLFVVTGGGLAALSMILLYRAKGITAECGFMLLLMLSMVIYPASLTLYNVLAVFPIVWVAARWAQFKLPWPLLIVGITGFYALSSIQSGRLMFYANLLFVLGLMMLIVWQRYMLPAQQTSQNRELSTP